MPMGKQMHPQKVRGYMNHGRMKRNCGLHHLTGLNNTSNQEPKILKWWSDSVWLWGPDHVGDKDSDCTPN